MLFVENLKPLKIYKRPMFLPTVESDKKKKSAIFLLTPNYESSKALMTSPLTINKLRFASYYIEKDLTYFISSKVMSKVEDVAETYVHNFTESDFYQSLAEMSAAERNKLSDSQFGLPKLRKYPLDSREHVLSAIKFFNYVNKDDEKELARNIIKAIPKYFDSGELPNVGKNNRFYKYYKKAEKKGLLEAYEIQSERGFYHYDGTYNCIVNVSGIDKPLRGRGEILILDPTNTKIYLVFKDNNKDYKVPGGGFEPNESHLEGTLREAKEEARIEVTAAYDTGIRYVEMFKNNVDETQSEFAPENRFYGFYTEVFVGTAYDTFDGELDTVDVDEKMTKGKFYDIEEVWDKLIPEHKKALNFVIKESYVTEGTKSTIDKDYKSKGKKSLSSLKRVHITESVINKYKKEYPFLSHVRCKDTKEYICDGYIWFDNDELVCMVGSCEYTDDHTKWIVSLEITKNYKGYGLSKQILDFATKTMNCKYLSVNKNNEIAKKVYDDYGFKVYHEDSTMYYMTIDRDIKESHITEGCETNLSNLTWYHLEPVRKGYNPKTAANGWDEELYSKSIDYAINNDIKYNRYCKDQDKIEAHVFTAGEELSSIYLGNITIYRHDDSFDWEWSEQEDIDQSYIDYLKDEVHPHLLESAGINIATENDITCSGYIEDIRILRYLTKPEIYNELLSVLELEFDSIPRINLIGSDREDIQIDRNDDSTGINIYCYSQSLDQLSIKQYITTVMTHMIIGLIVAKFSNLEGTIFPLLIANFITGSTAYLYDYAAALFKKYTMKQLFEKFTNNEFKDLYKDAKEAGITEIETVDDLFTEATSDVPTVASITSKIKHQTGIKQKRANSRIGNTVSRLANKIKDSIEVKTSTAPKKEEEKSEEQITESLLSALDEGAYIISGNYVTIFEDTTYDPILRKILYRERMVKKKEVMALLTRVKSDIPEIKYAYTDISRYQQRNLFVDLYYYNEAFFKNNEWKLKKGFGLYKEFLDRLINDKRIKAAGYQRRTVFIPINDWHINPSTQMWLYREDLNPVSIIYELMFREPNSLAKLFKGVDVVFFAKDKYFKIDPSDVSNAKKNAIKFKLFIKKINANEEFDQTDMDSTEDTPSKEAIKTDIMDRIETSKGVDLTSTTNKVKEEEKKSKSPIDVTVHRQSKVETPREEDKPEEKVISKGTVNKSSATSSSKEDETVLKTVVKAIDVAVANANDTEEALDNMDQDIDLKDILVGLDSLKDDSVNINAARAERMTQLDRELLDQEVKGRSIRDILGDESKDEEHVEIPPINLDISSPNEEWQNMQYMNFDQTYDLEKDIVNAFKHFSTVSRPLSIRNIKVEDNSTSEDRLDLYTVEYEDYRGKRYTIKLDIPRVKDKRFLLRGNSKSIQTQFFNMPIIKTDLDTCQIVTNYKKIIISRFNTVAGRSLPNTARLIKAADKYQGNKIKFVGGDNSRVCAKYVLPIDYIDLASVFTSIETSEIKIFFNQDEIRKLYDVNEALGVPYALQKKDNSILYYPNNETTPFVDIMIGAITKDNFKKYEDFFELYSSAKSPSRGTYTRARIMSSDIPLVVVCAYSEGLTKVLKKANVTYGLVDKLTAANRNDLSTDYIRFNDGYLIYNVNYNSSLLLNGLKDCDTLSHSISEIDDRNMYLEFLDNYGGRIKADGLDNFYDCEIDPITKETLKYYKLPTDYISVLLYANYLLSDNKFIRHTDTSSRRARRLELVAAYTYQVLSEAYGTYSNSIKHNRTAAPFSCKQSAVIDKILLDPTSSDYSVINMLNDVETSNAITTKGLSGMNSDRSYSLDKRTYDESMIGVVGMSTGFSANVGITRQATLDMNIEGNRGYVKDMKGNTEKMTTAKVLTATESVVPFASTHDDPIRVAMTFIQTSKHAVRTEESDPLLVTSGADEALAYICSDQFAHKAKKKGMVTELTENDMIIEYEDGIKEYINLKETIEKNSDGGFYVPLKLDADPKLKVGSKVKPNQIVAYDKSSLSNSLGETDNLAYNTGKLAKIAIINTDEGFEDSGVITEEMAKKLACRIVGKVECILDKNTNIYNVAKVGQPVEQGDTLLVWQTPYDEEEVNNLLKALANDSEAVSELGRHTIKSEVTGRIVDMKVYRTVEDTELSDSLKTLVRRYEKPISDLKKKLKEEGINETDLPANYPLKPTGKLKNAADGVLIEFYIEYTDILGVGDKITYNAANKAVIKNVIPTGKEPYTDFRPNEHISAFVSVTSIDKRLVSSTTLYGSLQKLLVELDRSCKDLAGIPYDDSEV